MATQWFLYNGTPGAGTTLDPQQYTSSATVPSCNTGTTVCAIFADTQIISGVRRPVITPTLQNEIRLADRNDVPSANVKLKLV
jgi:hypothetical protein